MNRYVTKMLFSTYRIPSILQYKTHPIPKHKCFSSRLAVVFAKSIEARFWVENEDVVGAAPTGDAPTASKWSTILLPTKVRLILETSQYPNTIVRLTRFSVSGHWKALCKDSLFWHCRRKRTGQETIHLMDGCLTISALSDRVLKALYRCCRDTYQISQQSEIFNTIYRFFQRCGDKCE